MSFLTKLFGSNTNNILQPKDNKNNNFAYQLGEFLSNLLSKDSYIARSDYYNFIC
jgi:hypothetical protein